MAPKEVHDTPVTAPIFNGLSPQYRVRLVRDVLVGLLCDDEPLPPDTIQHAAAYRAMICIIGTLIENECTDSPEYPGVSKDLLIDDGDDIVQKSSEEEKIENNKDVAVLQAKAQRVNKKLEKGSI